MEKKCGINVASGERAESEGTLTNEGSGRAGEGGRCGAKGSEIWKCRAADRLKTENTKNIVIRPLVVVGIVVGVACSARYSGGKTAAAVDEEEDTTLEFLERLKWKSTQRNQPNHADKTAHHEPPSNNNNGPQRRRVRNRRRAAAGEKVRIHKNFKINSAKDEPLDGGERSNVRRLKVIEQINLRTKRMRKCGEDKRGTLILLLLGRWPSSRSSSV